MFLEDTQIYLPYSCHAMTRSWLVHGFADQGARLYVGDTLASPSTLFQIDHHADHTHPESGARVGNLAHCAFSSAISGNARIFGGNPLIWNYQWITGEQMKLHECRHGLLLSYCRTLGIKAALPPRNSHRPNFYAGHRGSVRQWAASGKVHGQDQ